LDYSERRKYKQTQSKPVIYLKWLRRKWKAQWNSKLSSKFITYSDTILTLLITEETDQRLTEANEVLETGAKINTNYKKMTT
jgi:hypothetical protein